MEQNFISDICVFLIQALEVDQSSTKALFRRAQAWQGLKEYSKAMVMALKLPSLEC